MPAPPRPAGYDRRIALVLQGGGALGAYQAGVYAALDEAGYLPDWVAGISIGAINAALIAGNPPDRRVERLRDFWETVTTPSPPLPDPARRRLAATNAALFGQPGFFAPRSAIAYAIPPGPISYYDTTQLRGTLERLVDFDRINARETSFSVAAVNLRTGNFRWFDNRRETIGPAHVMASGALPPGFPPVEIDGDHYWDGGLVSNTPLQYVLDDTPRHSRLVFQVDLFHALGRLPETLDEVAEREKDIRFSSRTRAGTTTARATHELRHAVNALWQKLPPDLKETAEARRLHDFGCVAAIDIAHLIYRPAEPQGPTKDYEFSRATMQDRWTHGHADATATIAAAPWLAPAAPDAAVRVFDVTRSHQIK